MKCDIKKETQCSRVMSIDVEPAAIQKAYDAFYEDIKKSAKVPGFRSGKAPRHVLAIHYKDKAKDEVLKNLVTSSYYDALKNNQLNPLGYPDFTDIDFSEKKLTFKAKIEVKPEVKVKKYKGICVKKNKIGVDKKEIDELVERVLDGYAKYIPVEDRGVELGDFAVCDIENNIDGEEPEIKKDEWVEIKENDLIKGFAAQTVGMKTGEKREITVTISKDFPNEKVRGKKALFKVFVKEIKRKQMPELNEEFLKQLGEYKTIDEFRNAVSRDIEARKKSEENNRVERELIDKVEKDLKFDLPLSLVERRLEGLVKEGVQSLMQQGMPKETAESKADEMRKEFHPEAERQVKVAFILDAIGNAENIETEENDLEQRFQLMAKQYKQPVDVIKNYYEKSDLIDSLKAEIRNQKIVDFIKINAEIKEA